MVDSDGGNKTWTAFRKLFLSSRRQEGITESVIFLPLPLIRVDFMSELVFRTIIRGTDGKSVIFLCFFLLLFLSRFVLSDFAFTKWQLTNGNVHEIVSRKSSEGPFRQLTRKPDSLFRGKRAAGLRLWNRVPRAKCPLFHENGGRRGTWNPN